MTKIAKVALSADVKSFRSEMKQAKQILLDMSAMKIDPKVSKEFEDAMKNDLVKSSELLKNKIEEIEVSLKKLGDTGDDFYKSEKVQELIKEHSQYNEKLKETQTLLKEINKESKKSGGAGGAGAGLSKKLGSGALRMAGGMGLAMGFGSLYQRGMQLGQTGMDVREVTGGSSVTGRSSLGFTKMERLERGRGIGEQVRRDVGENELKNMVDYGEKLQRAFGVSGQTQAGFLGAARKGGAKDEQKVLASAVGDAVAAGIDDGRLSEYLSSMTGYMEGMSKGVDINQQSLTSFSASLAKMDFFKQNPERIFDAISKMDAVFKGGDEFQQAMSYMAINKAGGGGLDPASLELRKSLGLFGGIDTSTKEGRDKKKSFEDAGLGGLAETMAISGNKILENYFEQVLTQGKGKTQAQQALEFVNATGLGDEQGLTVFKELFKNFQQTGKVEMTGKASEAANEARKTPEDRLATIMESSDGNIVKLGEKMDALNNAMAEKVVVGIGGLVDVMSTLDVSVNALSNVVLGASAALTLGMTGLLTGLGGAAAGALATGASTAGALAAGLALPAMGVVAAGGAGVGAGMLANKGIDAWTQGKSDDGYEGNFVERLFFKLDKMFGGESSGTFLENQKRPEKEEERNRNNFFEKQGMSKDQIRALENPLSVSSIPDLKMPQQDIGQGEIQAFDNDKIVDAINRLGSKIDIGNDVNKDIRANTKLKDKTSPTVRQYSDGGSNARRLAKSR